MLLSIAIFLLIYGIFSETIHSKRAGRVFNYNESPGCRTNGNVCELVERGGQKSTLFFLVTEGLPSHNA